MPVHLERTVSIAFLEVRKDVEEVSGYETELYDYVFFTPRVDEIDPCERFKKSLKKLKFKKVPKQ